MRRLITMLASALVLLAIGFSSSTVKANDAPYEVYAYGEINGINNWDNNSGSLIKMTSLGDNAWEIKLTNTGTTKFKLLGKFSGWNDPGYYASATDGNDWKLNGNETDVECWRRKDGMSAGKCWYGDLNGKYLYVKWDTNAGDNGFKVSIKDQSSKPEETDNLYLFGQLGYSVCNGNWSDTYTSQCVLKKSGELTGMMIRVRIRTRGRCRICLRLGAVSFSGSMSLRRRAASGFG